MKEKQGYYFTFLLVLSLLCKTVFTQGLIKGMDEMWADSVFRTLSDDERIAQLMVIRTSAPGKGGGAVFYNEQVDSLVKIYNVGGVCLFQGTPSEQAELLNRIQSMARTPIMVTVDAEWGLGMRFAGVRSFPYQLTMGAMKDENMAYEVGKAIAAQCRRMNIHVNYAPVVDVNNNPNNPVIGYRSFGENREKVALFGTRIMQGMQDGGVMACAKHFPGHGDVDVDSHYDLPVINKSIRQMDSLELYPFKVLFKNGVGSVMIAHLFIPAIDSTPNRATSLSYNNVTNLMRNQLGYQGLTFTDALEMKGVAKFFPGGEAAVQSIIAGNDMLCLPGDVPQTIEDIKKAIADGRLNWDQIYLKCKRVLQTKFKYVVGRTGNIDTTNLLSDLNGEVNALRKRIAEKALTLLKKDKSWGPVGMDASGVLVVQMGAKDSDELAQAFTGRGAVVRGVGLDGAGLDEIIDSAKGKKFQKVIITIQGLGRNPSTKFGLKEDAIKKLEILVKGKQNMLVLMGNPYAIGQINQASFKNIAVAYEDDPMFQLGVFDWLTGLYNSEGSLPVGIGKWKAGQGLLAEAALKRALPETAGMDAGTLARIDDVAKEGIDQGAFPGCVVTVLRKGKMVFQKAYGYTTYEKGEPLTVNTIFDLASVSKISATNISLMKLYDKGKLDLKAPLGKYLSWLNGTDKDSITIESMMLHQSGLVSFIPFYREVIDSKGNPDPVLFSHAKSNEYPVTVTDQLFMTARWIDTMFQRIKDSKMYDQLPRYVYSDNNYILLAEVVKSITGKTIDRYAYETFYKPMGLKTTRYKIYEAFDKRQIAPTEKEKDFRQGLLQGYVHDPGAAMFGNVAGHAGLFSNATDLATLYQMLLNGGSIGKKKYLDPETISYFTSYQSMVSRRGYGFDKPEIGNDTLPNDKKYPADYVSPKTFGHTGYTGTCVWVDPEFDLVYVFLSNRVYPIGGENRKLLTLNIRSRIQNLIYESIYDKGMPYGTKGYSFLNSYYNQAPYIHTPVALAGW